MDRPWLIEQLQQFVELTEESSGFKWGGTPQYKALVRELTTREPTVKDILKAIRPGLQDYVRTSMSGWTPARDAALRGIGLLKTEATLHEKLRPDSPTMDVDKLHPWVWSAAVSFWESTHYRHAVQQAAESINAHLQAKLGRSDISNTQLVREAFSAKEPTSCAPRLRFFGGTEESLRSKHDGARDLGIGCFMVFRNLSSHGTDPSGDKQYSLEALAALSVLARLIEEATVVKNNGEGG